VIKKARLESDKSSCWTIFSTSSIVFLFFLFW